MSHSFPAVLIRGGTSKGLFISAEHLPENTNDRDRVLLAAMGSPDERQIDGLGGAHPLTSKVAVISESSRADADVDYLFLQVSVDKTEVSPSQNCGNMLAGVGPWAIEHGLVSAAQNETRVRIHMLNTGGIAVATVATPNGKVSYEGDTEISGVPGHAAAIPLEFLGISGSTCGALLPTGNVIDRACGLEVTCVDNGMPVILVRAEDLGLSGYETPEALERDQKLVSVIRDIRLDMGEKMKLGDVTKKTVPKVSIIAPPKRNGLVMTRTFIPHRVHQAIGVLGAVSVASGCIMTGSVAEQIIKTKNLKGPYSIEHPSGSFEVDLIKTGEEIVSASLIRTARKLMSGNVFVPEQVWSGAK